MSECHEPKDEDCHWYSRETGPTLAEKPVAVLPEDAAKRNDFPMADGLLDYFPAALAYVSWVSKIGNDQHNPGEPMHWARNKSTDHRNKIIKHLVDSGLFDAKGVLHDGYAAWRALANLQEQLEKIGWKPGRASRWD